MDVLENMRECARYDCQGLFFPANAGKRGRPQIYCSRTCRSRMAKRFTVQAQKAKAAQRRKWRMEQRWPLLVCSLGLDEALQERIKDAARSSHRKPHEEAHAALRWYYLEMWGSDD